MQHANTDFQVSKETTFEYLHPDQMQHLNAQTNIKLVIKLYVIYRKNDNQNQNQNWASYRPTKEKEKKKEKKQCGGWSRGNNISIRRQQTNHIGDLPSFFFFVFFLKHILIGFTWNQN